MLDILETKETVRKPASLPSKQNIESFDQQSEL